MPMTAKHRRARYAPVHSMEEEYIVEAGDDEGTKYRRVIQYGRDFEFQLNHDEALRTRELVMQGKKMPHFHGSTVRGRFSNKMVFGPTWLRIYRAGDLVGWWDDPTMSVAEAIEEQP